MTDKLGVFPSWLDAPRVLLVLSISLLLLMIGASVTYESAWSKPEQHSRISSMEIGETQAVEDAGHWGFGLAFGMVTLFALVASLMFAAQHSKYALQLKLAVLGGGIVYVATFVWMMLSYRNYVREGPSLLGPFAAPTTWMVFGLWAVPMIFVVIYCVKFDTWFAIQTESQGE
tara:strand:- start:198 stop:716 length:519 start_codon:yes stop_codon:yes gene_type:complete